MVHKWTKTDLPRSSFRVKMLVSCSGETIFARVNLAKKLQGCRTSRNELVKEVLRDYHYMEATGLGVPRKIINGMYRHNQTEVELIEGEDQFAVRLRL